MKSICFFASYFTSVQIPYYIKVYLEELNKQYGEVVFLNSKKELIPEDLEFLKKENIELQIEKNEGFDFGLWYKALQNRDLTSYDRLILVNDSAVLFSFLDKFVNWSETDQADFQGMTLSSAIEPHLQSYFLVIKKKAIPDTVAYFKMHGVLQSISDVIKTYEVGLSSYLVSKGFKLSAYVDNNGYKGEYSPYYHCIDYHISKKIPLIKKKILYSSYRKDELFTLARMNFRISVPYYIDLIKRANSDLILDFNKVLDEADNEMGMLQQVKYALTRRLIGVYRIFRKKH